MNKHFILTILTIAVTLISCNKNNSLTGLWEISEVKIENETMTPIARWMQFNEDGTQVSGNGWYRHSYGNYNFSEKNKTLSVENTNGTKDDYEPFKVDFKDSFMYWSRTEDGNSVTIKLKRIKDLPQSPADEIMGLWKLNSMVGNYYFYSSENHNKQSDYIFFRWDRKFVVGNENGKEYGIYNVHAHKNEVELIPYNKIKERSFWKFSIDENTLSLYLLNSDTIVSRKFERINEFPK